MGAAEREIVFEIEKIELIRKRAKTRLMYCEECGVESDVLSHVSAAELFETVPGKMFDFIRQNHCHYQVSYNGKIYLCVVSLIERMKRRSDVRVLSPIAPTS
jgi:hypothetical protein